MYSRNTPRKSACCQCQTLDGKIKSIVDIAISEQIKSADKPNGKLQSTTNFGAADVTELFEWEDGNPKREDRIGMFVAMSDGKICKASHRDFNILGVATSLPPSGSSKMAIVTMLGKIVAKDDGTCNAGDVCSIENGIATTKGNSTGKYFVLGRIDYNLITVILK